MQSKVNAKVNMKDMRDALSLKGYSRVGWEKLRQNQMK